MKLLVVLALLLPGFVGCATTGGTSSAPSFNQLALTAGTLNDTVVNTATSLVNAQTITKPQGQAVLAITDKAQAALTLATAAYRAGDQTTAAAKLAAATGALAGAQSCLAGPAATLVVCLQGVKTP